MITGVILAHNEEQNIVDCIHALKPHVDELLLIDTESSDRTVELARPLVDKILSHPNLPNFDAIRNIAIPEASFDWMWFVDADERIPEQTGQLVRNLIHNRGHEFEAITIPFKSYFCGQWIEHCGWWPGYTMPRVLKRGYFEFSEKLHGGVNHTGRSIRLAPDPQTAIDHYSYTSVEHYLEKVNRYTTTEASQMQATGLTHHWRRALRHMVHDVWQYYELNQGHRDGVRGWILSWLSGQYRWLSHAKTLDLAKSLSTDLAAQEIPQDLDEAFDLMTNVLAECRASAPCLPLGLIWRGPLWDPSGYADESRAFIKALAQTEREFAVQDIHWASQECRIPAADKALFRALACAKRPRYTATVTNCIPTVATPALATSLNILRTTFETDRLPDGWLEHIMRYDETWVISRHNYRTFVRSGVPPERVRIVPSCIDLDLFRPDGDKLELPGPLSSRFVFLSVLDWGLRKGWDLLLRAYVKEFAPTEGVGLLLKITRNHGHPLTMVHQQADAALEDFDITLADRPDILIWDANLDASQLTGLYRSAGAFILPSRGEGWGRPYMEAMACGLPCVGTNASGNIDFMNEQNSFLVACQEVDVPESAAAEIPSYAGHRWHEPDFDALCGALRSIVDDPLEASRRAAVAVSEVRANYNLASGRIAVERALRLAEAKFEVEEPPPIRSNQIRVELEGELQAGHSFSKINETLLRHLSKDEDIALSCKRIFHNPTSDSGPSDWVQLQTYIDRSLGEGPHVTIRHAFPPNWTPLAHGKWVHIQPFEYGHLPQEWVAPLRDQVDEIWAPSEYVRRVYERSGVPAEKISVIPWGIDSQFFRPDAIPLLLPTSRSFRFLFVGGMIARKGFDRVLEAYLTEFSRDEDVALVVKGMGEDTFYRFGNFRSELLKAASDPNSPEIIHIDKHLTEGQLACLYATCSCLVAPYRGEGFGLPVLEAMGCGLPVIVPVGGATDDFVNDEIAFLVDAKEAVSRHEMRLAGPCLEFDVSLSDIRRTMRQAEQSRSETRRRGLRAAEFVRSRFTWESSIAQMKKRLIGLAEGPSRAIRRSSVSAASPQGATARTSDVTLTVGVTCQNDECVLAQVLSFISELADDVIVFDRSSKDRSGLIAKEYGARFETVSRTAKVADLERLLVSSAHTSWAALVRPQVPITPQVVRQIRGFLAEVPTGRRTASLTIGGIPPSADRIAPSRAYRLRFYRVAPG